MPISLMQMAAVRRFLIDFKSVQTGKPNGTTLDIDPSPADHCQYPDAKHQDIAGRHPVFQPGQQYQIIVHALWFPASARIPALLFP